MVIIVYTKYNKDNIKESIGQSEYSYYFVLKQFLPILQSIGEVKIVTNPLEEVDVHYENALKQGQECLFLCFTAPHNAFINLKCPTIPVFAWEFDTIPNEAWNDNEMNNWVEVLRKLGGAITHSQHSKIAVQKELGEDFPIIVCPSPLPDNVSFSLEELRQKQPIQEFKIKKTKATIDTFSATLQDFNVALSTSEKIDITHQLLKKLSRKVLKDTLPKFLYQFLRGSYFFLGKSAANTIRAINYFKSKKRNKSKLNNSNQPSVPKKAEKTTVSGIIYTSILNIADDRKNYGDMLAAFCFAMQNNPDAVLVIKTSLESNPYFFREKIIHYLNKMPPFKCRIVVLGYYLDNASYNELINATSFYLNTSYGEGQCLPLMEYMASGVPAIAPYATAMTDYINRDNAFCVKTASLPTIWQHDERVAIRTVRHRPDWYALLEALTNSYELVKNNPEAYQEMSIKASETLMNHCSAEKTKEKLTTFFEEILQNKGV